MHLERCWFRRICLLSLALSLPWLVNLRHGDAQPAKQKDKKTNPKESPHDSSSAWKPLFDHKTLAPWKSCKFGGEGEVTVKDNVLVLPFGNPMTGIVYEEKFPTVNYEIRVEAMRAKGTDFFCGMTFPVKKSHISFIAGGWGGTVIGLSSIDSFDASENDTTDYFKFKQEKWYKIRARVTTTHIQVWIDDKQVVDQNYQNSDIDTRIEMELCKPLGFATWQTEGRLRKIEYRKIEQLPSK